MLIDWFTVGAQAVNFLILAWLMKRFLYKPILNAIDEREKKVATELADADAKRDEAHKERDTFQKKNDEFDKQRAAILTKATDDANAKRGQLLDEARKAADTLSATQDAMRKSDALNLNQSLRSMAQQEVFAIARKALSDLASTSLEEHMVEAFLRQLGVLDDTAKDQLANAFKSDKSLCVVRSTFVLPDRQRTAIQSALKKTFSADISIQYETAPDLISGIELSTNGQKIGWNISDYLTSMEKNVDEFLKDNVKPEAKAASEPAKDKPEKSVGKHPKHKEEPEIKTNLGPAKDKPKKAPHET